MKFILQAWSYTLIFLTEKNWKMQGIANFGLLTILSGANSDLSKCVEYAKHQF